jgi:hypothetical protein
MTGAGRGRGRGRVCCLLSCAGPHDDRHVLFDRQELLDRLRRSLRAKQNTAARPTRITLRNTPHLQQIPPRAAYVCSTVHMACGGAL